MQVRNPHPCLSTNHLMILDELERIVANKNVDADAIVMRCRVMCVQRAHTYAYIYIYIYSYIEGI